MCIKFLPAEKTGSSRSVSSAECRDFRKQVKVIVTYLIPVTAQLQFSAALGIARGRDLAGDNYNVISVFGDGALTGGMMYEAMNDAGHSKTTAYTYFERQRNVYFKKMSVRCQNTCVHSECRLFIFAQNTTG